MANHTAVMFVQIIERPARKLIVKRSQSAGDYFAYVAEIGSGEHNASSAWDVLMQITDALAEPVGVWLPAQLCPPGTGTYAHGVEVADDYRGEIPAGFDVIALAPSAYILFQGEPYDDADFVQAVGACMERIDAFNPEVYAYQYAPEIAPRMQLSPQGWRGYIEMRPVVRM
ncbi:MAG: hypothetical protein ACO3F2_12955 [Roseiflexaceae bacterium]